MSSFNNKDELLKQYETAANLNSRVNLHQLFSTNKLGWTNWVFQNYKLKPNQTILELGCGNGDIWSTNANKIPEGVKLILSDFSQGMLDSAEENTRKLTDIEYRVIDAQCIPYCDNTFDIIIANHMLYHVPDVNKALKEISRVLKPEGVFYSTTIGVNNLKEIIEILYNFDAAIDFAQESVTNAYGLETGEEKLKKYFKTSELFKYEDSLHITEFQPLIDYILSSQGIGNVNEVITGERVLDFTNYIKKLFDIDGYLDVVKDAGILIASAPIK